MSNRTITILESIIVVILITFTLLAVTLDTFDIIILIMYFTNPLIKIKNHERTT